MADSTSLTRKRLQSVPLHAVPGWEHPQSQLPLPLTSFVGRAAETAAVRSLMLRPDVRLVSLTGPGGVGKTRLAIRVAEGLAGEFVDGIVFVPLANVLDANLLPRAVATSLGLAEARERSAPDAVSTYLRDRSFLLVLDNFEHLLAAGPIAVKWLADCPQLAILATSRSVLRVSGEHDVAVSRWVCRISTD